VKKSIVKSGYYRLMGSYEKGASIGVQKFDSSNETEYFSFTPTTTSVPPKNYSNEPLSKYRGDSFNYFVVAE
jgi:hypothetical protein